MKPPLLQPNDKIAIIAPSGRVFENELQENLSFIRSLGLKSVFGENLFNDFYSGYHYAGTQAERLSDFQKALDDPEIKAIWCARGGYGAVHLLEKLDWKKFKQYPKWIIGYSDITALHNEINNFGFASLHGLTVKKLNTTYTPETFQSLEDALFHGKLEYEIPGNPLNRKGSAKGKLVGGNLSLVYSLSGTPHAILGKENILFLEDWCENWYHLDRMLNNLKLSGLFDRISGLILGSFTQMDIKDENPDFESPYDPSSYQIIHNFIKDYDFPVCFGFPAGHTGDNRVLIFGSDVHLHVTNEKSMLEFE